MQCGQAVLAAVSRARVGRGEGQEDVAAAVSAQAARAGHAERGAFGDAPQLMREQRRVRGEHHDQRTLLGQRILAVGEGRILGQVLADGHTCHRQLVAAAEIGLHQRADRPAAQPLGQFARGGARATLELVTDHARPAANVAFGQRPALRGSQRRQHVLGLHVELIHII